jgi:branched-subunit amino acid ABC-type transport system permease component
VLTFLFGGVANGPDLAIWALPIAILCAGLLTGLMAIIVERLVYRPLRNAGRIVALLAALGVSLFMQNAGQQTVGAKVRTFPHTFRFQRFPRSEIKIEDVCAGKPAASDISIVYTRKVQGGVSTEVENIASRGNEISENSCKRIHEIFDRAKADGLDAKLYSYPAITVTNAQGLILLMLGATSLGLYLLVQHTKFGRAMRAVSHDFDASALMGINVNRIISGTFFIGAVVAGMGGTLAGGMYYGQVDPLMGLLPGLKAFIAAVFGGIGSIPGALLGGILLGVAEKMVEAYGSSLYTDAFTFGILILMLLVRPSGLLGKASSDKL